MTNTIFTDVTGIDIEIVPEEQAKRILSLSPEQRQFVKVFADTIKNPHEIYKLWRRDPANADNSLLIRAYIQILDLSELVIDAPNGISVVEFVWDKKWKIYSMHMLLGELAVIHEKINSSIRSGERLYCYE